MRRGRVAHACSAWRANGGNAGAARRGAVRGIADQRMADRREVHADLVRAAGLERQRTQRRDRRSARAASTCVRAGLPLATTAIVVRARSDGGRSARRRSSRARSRRARRARYSRLTRARRELRARGGLRLERLGDDQQAARVLVEAMHDARARQRRERRRVMQQRVEQRAVAIAAARMHDEARRLVDARGAPRPRARSSSAIACGACGVVGARRPSARRSTALAAARRWRVAAHGAPSTRDVAGVDPRLAAGCANAAGSSCASAWSRRRPAQRRRARVSSGRGRRGVAAATRPVGYNSRGSRSDADDDDALAENGMLFGCCACALLALCVVAPAAACCRRSRTKRRAGRPSSSTSTAHDAMIDGNYTRAVKLFETLEARFPYGRYAQQAILEGAYRQLARRASRRPRSRRCDRFIRTYPNHPNVDYAYYLKGLVYFREDQGLFGYVYELDLSERDPKAMRESFAAFKELVAQFPDSRYAEDARDRMRYLTNALGDVRSARRALLLQSRRLRRRGQSRAGGAASTIRRRPANEDALDILVQSYDKLGPDAAARRHAARAREDVSRQQVPRRGGRQAVVEVLVADATFRRRSRLRAMASVDDSDGPSTGGMSLTPSVARAAVSASASRRTPRRRRARACAASAAGSARCAGRRACRRAAGRRSSARRGRSRCGSAGPRPA